MDHPLEDVVRHYTGFAVIEAGWKEIKSILEVRPVRHRLDRRMEAHLEICQLAYLLQQMHKLRVREKTKVTGFVDGGDVPHSGVERGGDRGEQCSSASSH